MRNQIERQYDPENNCLPDGPAVTWAEMDLYEAVVALTARVEKLEQMRSNIIDALEGHQHHHDLSMTIHSAIKE